MAAAVDFFIFTVRMAICAISSLSASLPPSLPPYLPFSSLSLSLSLFNFLSPLFLSLSLLAMYQ